METPRQEELLKPSRIPLSIVLPTYNESQNITRVIDSISDSIPEGTKAEIIVVDDSSPDGTGSVVADYANRLGQGMKKRLHIEVINRPGKMGLSSAILAGVESACGDVVVVMDSDMSHPPQTIPRMLEELAHSKCDIVVASRYIKGGGVSGWPFKRKLMSKGATKIAQYSLGITVKDPMSGFFAFRRQIIEGIKFDAIGYKMLLEILVKAKGARIKEIPYTFTNRRLGSSKLDTSTMIDYVRAVWRLYRYGRSAPEEKRRSVRFLSKAGRFYTVGASGLLVNYLVSFVLTALFPAIWYLHATIAGIALSITSNFILNKLWTFEDRDFSAKRTLVQYGMFAGFSAFGALVQLGMVYYLVESQGQSYPLALILAVATASISNFLLNKKWTFKERVWG
ncbi:MAG: glycosyltransferase family 2 protein [Nitrososphaera sp.]|uniref:glycosyltransferase n=2 Tax=Nitrososphaera sp. TaxID=1971748 RepID=UPI0025EC53C6|nr:glycosyltransferase family 2 protein [Nitrososphaera sp.]